MPEIRRPPGIGPVNALACLLSLLGVAERGRRPGLAPGALKGALRQMQEGALGCGDPEKGSFGQHSSWHTAVETQLISF